MLAMILGALARCLFANDSVQRATIRTRSCQATRLPESVRVAPVVGVGAKFGCQVYRDLLACRQPWGSPII